MALLSHDSQEMEGNKIMQYLAAIAANLGVICVEMHYGWSSPFLPVLRSGNYTFTITSEEESYLAVIPLIGAILGAILTGIVVDICGRKRIIIFSSIPFIISWLLVGFASSSSIMFVGRFLAGTMDGLTFTVVPMYLGEIAEPKTRGLLTSICPISIVFGLLLVNILGAFLALATVAVISVIFPLLLLVIFPWMPESPYFCVMKGELRNAKRSLQIFRGKTDVSDELDRIQEAIESDIANKGKYLDLVMVPSNRKAMVIALGLRTFQQLTGTTAFIFYCQTIFEQVKDFMSPTLATIIYFSVNLIMSALASAIVDFSGRKPLLIISIIGTGVMLLTNGIYLYLQHCNCTTIDISSIAFVPMASLIVLVVVFSIGLHTIPLLIAGEIFPTNVKGFALCVVDVTYSVVVTLVSMYFHWSNEEFGMHVPFFTFAGCCVLGLVFIVFKVPETKGKTLEDIQMELRGGTRIVSRKRRRNFVVQ